MKARTRVAVALSVAALFMILVSCKPAHPADPVSVVKATLDAINSGQAETAASFFADDAVWISAYRQATGIVTIREMLRLTTIPTKTRLEIREISADGPDVNGVITLKSTIEPDGSILRLTARVQDGKIKSMTWAARG